MGLQPVPIPQPVMWPDRRTGHDRMLLDDASFFRCLLVFRRDFRAPLGGGGGVAGLGYRAAGYAALTVVSLN